MALAAADIFVKAAAGKVPDSLGMLLYGIVPFITGLAWFLIDRHRSHAIPAQPGAMLFALAVGVMFTLVTFCMYAAFRNGAPISIASPVIRLGGLILAGVAGFIVWKEPMTGRYLAGIGLVGSGMYLIMTR